MIEAVDRAGTPATATGDQAAFELSQWAVGSRDDLQDARDQLAERGDSLEGSIRQLANAAVAIATSLDLGVRTLDDVARNDPDLDRAFAAASTCRELKAKELDG